MIDFLAKPRIKSEEEIEFDKLNEIYTERFGKPYVFMVGLDSLSWEETLADIRQRLETGEPQPEPDYQPGIQY